MIIPSENLVECIEDTHYDKITNFQRPGKMLRASWSEQSDFL